MQERPFLATILEREWHQLKATGLARLSASDMRRNLPVILAILAAAAVAQPLPRYEVYRAPSRVVIDGRKACAAGPLSTACPGKTNPPVTTTGSWSWPSLSGTSPVTPLTRPRAMATCGG